MLFRKTPTNERGKYVYRFNDGTVSVIAEGREAEVWIKSLHSFDDAEVYNNIKNSRPQLEDWQKKAVEEWKAQHPGEEPDPLKKLLYEKLSELPEEDQELYCLYFIEGYSQDEIGEMKGVSQNTISKKIRRIQKKLTEMCREEI